MSKLAKMAKLFLNAIGMVLVVGFISILLNHFNVPFEDVVSVLKVIGTFGILVLGLILIFLPWMD